MLPERYLVSGHGTNQAMLEYQRLRCKLDGMVISNPGEGLGRATDSWGEVQLSLMAYLNAEERKKLEDD